MITEYLKQILSARYGRDVRQAIHDGIQQCYYDGKAGAIDLQARQDIEALNGEVESLKDADNAINENIQALGNDVEGLKEADNTINQTLQALGDDVSDLKVSAIDITETTETAMPNSCEGRLLFKEIVGKTEELTSTGANLFNPNAVSKGYELNQNGSTSANSNYWVSDYIEVDGGKNYYLTKGTSKNGVSNCFYDANKTFISVVSKNEGLLTAPSNAKYVRFNGTDTRLIMFNEGDTALPYEPYGVGTPFIRSVEINKIKTHDDNGNESSITFSEPIELNKIGDLQDVYVDGKLTKRLVKVVFDGTEAFEVISGSTGGGYEYRMNLNIQAKNSSHSTCANAICNVAKVNDAVFSWNNNIEMFAITNNVFYLRQPSWTGVTNVDTLKAKLKSLFDSGNPVHAVYEIATPITALSTADQVALNSLKTCDGVTYLEIDSPLQPEFVAEYGTSKVGGVALEGLLVARNNELRITALES